MAVRGYGVVPDCAFRELRTIEVRENEGANPHDHAVSSGVPIIGYMVGRSIGEKVRIPGDRPSTRHSGGGQDRISSTARVIQPSRELFLSEVLRVKSSIRPKRAGSAQR